MNSTRLGEFTHGVYTHKATASKRLGVSILTPVPRDQFQIHELTRDIYRYDTLPSPVRDWSWLDDDSHAKEEPSELPSPMRDYPWLDDDSHAKEEPSELPSPVRDCP